MAELQQERKELQATWSALELDRQATAKSLKAILEPSIANVDDGLSALVAQRSAVAGAISLFDELGRLDQIAQQLEPPPLQYVEFAKAVEQVLKAWSFPELDGVAFDTTTEDIVISGKARKDNGKGYRAITYAAFVVAVLQETQRKNLAHPGFVVLDSPLVTYREPEEHMGEGVKNAFYRNLAAMIAPAQVIVLESEDPPEDLKSQISFEAFTKNRKAGRYGLFPPLPPEKP